MSRTPIGSSKMFKEYTVRVFGNGDIEWYKDGQLHREEGPAVEYINGEREWWLNGQKKTQEEFINHLIEKIKELSE